MTYRTYTHNYIVKNSKEVLKNAYLSCKQGSDNTHSLGEAKEYDRSKPVTIMVPGFINLHCHLAYSKLELKSQALFPWLEELYKACFSNNNYSARSNVLDGIDDLFKFGTTFVVDNCFSLKDSYEAISKKKIKALIGLEVFGSDPKDADKILESRIQEIQKYDRENPNIDLCLSPHAVYDVSKELWQKCLEWSKANNKILLSHIAESESEEIFMQDIKDPRLKSAKEFWQKINSLEAKEQNWQSYKSSVDFLIQNKLAYENLVLAHGVYCSKKDLEELQKHSVKLINCPRSNAYLKNACADTQSWKDLGIEFAMGTDSAASNYDLDLRKELLANKHLNPQEKFDKLTIDAAKILAKDKELGSLEPGKAADFVILELIDNDVITQENIFNFILDPAKTRVKEVYINGESVYNLVQP